MKIKIVSGGQTGVDRGALDAALEAGFAVGGWCPKGRKAEDGTIDLIYPLQEHESANYIDRTRQNVIDSDATLIIYFNRLSGGTLKTVEFCKQLNKKHIIIDADSMQLKESISLVSEYIKTNKIKTLNVAGPRASNNDKAYSYSKELILLLNY